MTFPAQRGYHDAQCLGCTGRVGGSGAGFEITQRASLLPRLVLIDNPKGYS